jgi:ATP-dependent RNA helicase RhlE
VTSSFSQLDLVEPLQRALATEKYTQPTPIQAQAIPHLLAGRDLLGIAQTGTGKTAAFALPILQRLSAQAQPAPRNSMRALILTPTRELALQIAESFRAYGRHLGLRTAVIFGGVGQQPQVDALRRGIDILVATPGRLLDLKEQGHVRFDGLSVFVLDEADRMLDMGFIHDVRRIAGALPKQRQSLLFSATMPPEIERLVGNLLKDPVRIEVTPAATTVELIDQRVMFVDTGNKRALLTSLLKDTGISRALVFTRTKHGANRVAEGLSRGGIKTEAIHGNKSQAARQRALGDFRVGKVRVLVATDIAARGIDIDGISHVFNYDIPNVPESYVHRIGRTARAGAAGVAISFCDGSEKGFLRDIENLTRRKIAVVEGHGFPAVHGGGGRPAESERGRHQPRGNHRGRGNGHGHSQGHGNNRGHGNSQGHGHGQPRAAHRAEG